MVSEMKVEKLTEVLVQVTKPEYWSVNKKARFCTQTMVHNDGRKTSPPDAMFVAFYRTAPEMAITHVAKVESIESNVPTADAYSGTSLQSLAQNWGTLDKVYHLRDFVEIPLKIPLGKKPARGNYRKTTIAKLMSAKTIDDL